MSGGAHFGCPKFTFDRISGHFRTIRNFNYLGNFGQNGCRRQFSMSEIRFRSHFMALEIFYKMAAGHFRCSKIMFDCISGHCRSIGHFGCLKFTFDSNSGHFRSIQAAILNLRNHFQSHFWTFQIAWPFWMSEIHFQCHF